MASGSKMYGLQQSHIEYLCIAAEIIAALLLISLFIPSRRRTESSEPTADSNAPANALPALELDAIRETILGYVCYRTLAMDQGLKPSEVESREPLPHSVLQLAKWEDRITGLGNQSFAETFLEQWFSFTQSPRECPRECPREKTWFSLFAVEAYTEFLHKHGAFEFEQHLRSIGKRFHDRLPSSHLAFRIAPDRFLVVQSGVNRNEALANLKMLDLFGSSDSELQLVCCTLSAPQATKLLVLDLPASEEGSPLSSEAMLEALDQAIQTTSDNGWASSAHGEEGLHDSEHLSKPSSSLNNETNGEMLGEQRELSDDEMKIVSELENLTLPKVLAKEASPLETPIGEKQAGDEVRSSFNAESQASIAPSDLGGEASAHEASQAPLNADQELSGATVSARATREEIEAMVNKLPLRQTHG